MHRVVPKVSRVDVQGRKKGDGVPERDGCEEINFKGGPIDFFGSMRKEKKRKKNKISPLPFFSFKTLIITKRS